MKYSPPPQVPVLGSVKELEQYVNKSLISYFCVYIADKSTESWNRSTSRRYMNLVSSSLRYVPFNVKINEESILHEIVEFARIRPEIAGINFTHPHKSNRGIKHIYCPETINFDCLIKKRDGVLKAYDLNGFSFGKWVKQKGIIIENVEVVVLGIGGAGTSVARRIANMHPSHLYLIDNDSKIGLVKELEKLCPTTFSYDIPDFTLPTIVINATGKDCASGDESTSLNISFTRLNVPSIYIDLNPHETIHLVQKATTAGWIAFGGGELNAINDFRLLKLLSDYGRFIIPDFSTFRCLVKSVS